MFDGVSEFVSHISSSHFPGSATPYGGFAYRTNILVLLIYIPLMAAS